MLCVGWHWCLLKYLNGLIVLFEFPVDIRTFLGVFLYITKNKKVLLKFKILIFLMFTF